MKVSMRKPEMQMSRGDTIDLLQQGEYGILSMCSPENGPYGIPMSYIYLNNRIYFHGAKRGIKLSIIRENNRLSFCVVGKTQVIPEQVTTLYESVIVYGMAQEITEEDERHAVLVGFAEKYCPDHMEIGMLSIQNNIKITSVFALSITEMTGKRKET